LTHLNQKNLKKTKHAEKLKKKTTHACRKIKKKNQTEIQKSKTVLLQVMTASCPIIATEGDHLHPLPDLLCLPEPTTSSVGLPDSFDSEAAGTTLDDVNEKHALTSINVHYKLSSHASFFQFEKKNVCGCTNFDDIRLFVRDAPGNYYMLPPVDNHRCVRSLVNELVLTRRHAVCPHRRVNKKRQRADDCTEPTPKKPRPEWVDHLQLAVDALAEFKLSAHLINGRGHGSGLLKRVCTAVGADATRSNPENAQPTQLINVLNQVGRLIVERQLPLVIGDRSRPNPGVVKAFRCLPASTRQWIVRELAEKKWVSNLLFELLRPNEKQLKQLLPATSRQTACFDQPPRLFTVTAGHASATLVLPELGSRVATGSVRGVHFQVSTLDYSARPVGSGVDPFRVTPDPVAEDRKRVAGLRNFISSLLWKGPADQSVPLQTGVDYLTVLYEKGCLGKKEIAALLKRFMKSDICKDHKLDVEDHRVWRFAELMGWDQLPFQFFIHLEYEATRSGRTVQFAKLFTT
jgi:hypothetical protein